MRKGENAFNPLPGNKFSKLKEFADDNFKFYENGIKLSNQVENTVGKGEIARYEHFLLFPQCFQKACFPGASKGVIVWEWVNQRFLLFPQLFYSVQEKIIILCTFNLSSANAFTLVLSMKLSFGEESSDITVCSSSFGMGKTHCGKRRKCWLPAFSPFLTMFSKGFLFRVIKSLDCVVKG